MFYNCTTVYVCVPVFRVNLPCTGFMSAEVDVHMQVNVNILSTSNITALKLRRKKVCLKGTVSVLVGVFLLYLYCLSVFFLLCVSMTSTLALLSTNQNIFRKFSVPVDRIQCFLFRWIYLSYYLWFIVNASSTLCKPFPDNVLMLFLIGIKLCANILYFRCNMTPIM